MHKIEINYIILLYIKERIAIMIMITVTITMLTMDIWSQLDNSLVLFSQNSQPDYLVVLLEFFYLGVSSDDL